jgi:hypothetical protein
MSAFWVVAIILLIFVGHYVFHKIKQLKIQVKKLEIELYFYIDYYGKERQAEREREKTAQTEKKEE